MRQLSPGGMVGSGRNAAVPYISYATMNRAGKLHASRGRHRRGRVSSERRGWDAGTWSRPHDGDAPGTPHHRVGRGQPTVVAYPYLLLPLCGAAQTVPRVVPWGGAQTGGGPDGRSVICGTPAVG